MNLFRVNNFKHMIFKIILILLIVSIILNPSLALNSARDGLNTWFNILLPSLLPFFILSELFIASGFVETFGRLLQPIMKPIFNVPGPGAFPLVMGIISGYPVGAKLSSRLRENGIISRIEGDRLITFTSTSGPLFMLGAVLVGMLGNPNLRSMLLLPHYMSILTIGVLFRFYRANSKYSLNPSKDIFSIKKRENIPLSKLLANSVVESMNSIFLVGGFVIFYNVIIELLLASKFTNYILLKIAKHLSINPSIVEGIFSGFIELTTGCKKISQLNIDLFHKILILNFLIAWGGLSILSQTTGFISQTDLNVSLYIFSKLLHGLISCIYTYILYSIGFYRHIKTLSIDVFIMEENQSLSQWIYTFVNSTKSAMAICIFFIILSIFVHQLWNKKEA